VIISSGGDCHVTLAVGIADVTIGAVQGAERTRGLGSADSGKQRCFRLESNQAPAFRRGGGTVPYRKQGKRARAQNRTGVAQGRPVYSRPGVHRPPLAWGDYPVSIRARGVHNPLCCLYTIITVDQEGLEPPHYGL
jgi:hypothetical protein